MIARTRHSAARPETRQALTGSPPAPDHADERLWWYLHIMRAGAYERHYRTCKHCPPESGLARETGPCPVGLALAQGADDALGAARAAASLIPAGGGRPGQLW